MSNIQLRKDHLAECIDATMSALKDAAIETPLSEFVDMLLEAMASEFDSRFVQEFAAAVQNSEVWFSVDGEA